MFNHMSLPGSWSSKAASDSPGSQTSCQIKSQRLAQMQHNEEQKLMGAHQFSIKILPNLPSITEYHYYYLNCQYALELPKLCLEIFK